MTCIVGLRTENSIIFGGDSAGSSGGNIIKRKDKKVFVKNDVIYGYAGSYRIGQVLRFKFKMPKYSEGSDLFYYMCTHFIDELQKCFRDAGVQEVSDEVKNHSSEILIAFKNRIFQIHSDYQVGESDYEFDAMGSGKEYALGSLISTGAIDNKLRVIMALSSAEEFCSSVRHPFHIIEYFNNGEVTDDTIFENAF